MWECEKCNTFNPNLDNLCRKCKNDRMSLHEHGLKINAPSELIEFIELVEKKEAEVKPHLERARQFEKSAEQKLKAAQEMELRTSSLIKEHEFLKNQIKALRAEFDPLHKATEKLKSEAEGAKSEMSRIILDLDEKKKFHKDDVRALEKSSNELENKIEQLKKTYRNIIVAHLKGISALILLIAVASILAYLIYYTVYRADKIEVSISYNLGEIIAAVFAGSGIAVAGFAYAKSVLKHHKE